MLLHGQAVVATLAVGGPDRVHGREVDDVEAHPGDGREAPGGGLEGAGGPQPGLRVLGGPLGAGEDLVPGAGEGQRALHPPGVGRAGADEVAQRGPLEHLPHLVVGACGQPLGRVERAGAQGADGPVEHVGVLPGPVDLVEGPLEHAGALLEHQLDVDAGLDLDRPVVHPRAVGVGPPFDAEAPYPLLVRVHDRLPVRETGVGLHHGDVVLLVVGVDQDRRGVDGVVALAEHRGGEGKQLADHRPGRPPPGVHHGFDVQDGDATDGLLAEEVQDGSVDPGGVGLGGGRGRVLGHAAHATGDRADRSP